MFLVFAFSQYYPSGGAHDFIGFARNREDALRMALEAGRDHYQIVTEDMRIVESG